MFDSFYSSNSTIAHIRPVQLLDVFSVFRSCSWVCRIYLQYQQQSLKHDLGGPLSVLYTRTSARINAPITGVQFGSSANSIQLALSVLKTTQKALPEQKQMEENAKPRQNARETHRPPVMIIIINCSRSNHCRWSHQFYSSIIFSESDSCTAH